MIEIKNDNTDYISISDEIYDDELDNVDYNLVYELYQLDEKLKKNQLELLNALREADKNKKLTIITHPAGTGKTTTQQLWHNDEEMKLSQSHIITPQHNLIDGKGNLISMSIENFEIDRDLYRTERIEAFRQKRPISPMYASTWFHSRGREQLIHDKDETFTYLHPFHRERVYCALNDIHLVYNCFLNTDNKILDEIGSLYEKLENESTEKKVKHWQYLIDKNWRELEYHHKLLGDFTDSNGNLNYNFGIKELEKRYSKKRDKANILHYKKQLHICRYPAKVYERNWKRIDEYNIYKKQTEKRKENGVEKEYEYYICPFYNLCESTKFFNAYNYKPREIKEDGIPKFNKIFSPLAQMPLFDIYDEIVSKKKESYQYCKPDRYIFEEYPNFMIQKLVNERIFEESGLKLVEIDKSLYRSNEEKQIAKRFKLYRVPNASELNLESECSLNCFCFKKALNSFDLQTIHAIYFKNKDKAECEFESQEYKIYNIIEQNKEDEDLDELDTSNDGYYLIFGKMKLACLSDNSKKFIFDGTGDILNVCLDFNKTPDELEFTKSSYFNDSTKKCDIFPLTDSMTWEKCKEHYPYLEKIVKAMPIKQKNILGFPSKSEFCELMKKNGLTENQLPYYYGGRGRNNLDTDEGRNTIVFGTAGMTPLNKFMQKLIWIESKPPILEKSYLFDRIKNREKGIRLKHLQKRFSDEELILKERDAIIEEALNRRQTAETIQLWERFRTHKHPFSGHLLITHKDVRPSNIKLRGELVFLKIFAEHLEHINNHPIRSDFMKIYQNTTKLSDEIIRKKKKNTYDQYLDFLEFGWKYFFKD